MSKDLETRKTAGALAVNPYEGDSGAGSENITAADKSVAYMFILQDGSPQVKSKHEKFVPGAKPGAIMISSPQELIDPDKGCVVLPCFTEHHYVEWVPRDKGGGFVGVHELNSPVVAAARSSAKEKNKFFTPAGNQLIETFYIYGLKFALLGDPAKAKSLAELIDVNSMGMPVIIPFTSTKIQPYKQINTLTDTFKVPGVPFPANIPPKWAFPLLFRTKLESRTAGDSYNFDISFALGKEIKLELLTSRFNEDGTETLAYRAARMFYQTVRAGNAKVDYSQQGNSAGGESTGGTAAPDREFPF